MSPDLTRRVTVTLRSFHIGAICLLAFAVACLLKGYTGWGIAAVIAALFAMIFSVETLRHFVIILSRETRR